MEKWSSIIGIKDFWIFCFGERSLIPSFPIFGANEILIPLIGWLCKMDLPMVER